MNRVSRHAPSALALALVVSGLVVAPAARARMHDPVSPIASRAPATDMQHPTAARVGSPAVFEANSGQFDPRVRYAWRGRDASLVLTDDAAVLTVAGAPETRSATVSRMRFVGTAASAHAAPDRRASGVSNYLIGRSRDRWVTGVERFESVRLASLYPGVDAVFYGAGAGYEYDFVVAPGADPSAISIAFDGTRRATVDTDGTLVLDGASATIRHRAPVAYQIVDGARKVVSATYRVRRDGTVGFDLGDYDTGSRLVIDPVVTYSSYLGGSSPDRAQAVAVDADGYIYVAGRTISSNFPVTSSFQLFNAGNYDVFVSKLTPAGDALVYSTYIGGSEFDSAQALAVTPGGQVVIAGYTGSADYPVTASFQPSLAAGIDGVVTVLDAAGTGLALSSYLGGSTSDFCYGVATDGTYAYVTGQTNSDDLEVTSAIQDTYGGGAHDAFVAKIDIAMGTLANLTYLGGGGDDGGFAIAVDSDGVCHVTGQAGPGFPLLNPFQSVVGGTDAFLTKILADFSGYVSSSYLGGSSLDVGTGIAVDPAGASYITGYTQSANFPTTIPVQSNFGGITDAFVTKVSPTGALKVYSTYLGGSVDDRANGIAVDAAGSAYIVGQTRSSDFPTKFAFQSTNGGNSLNDVFATKLGATGRFLIYSSYIGGSSTEVGYGVAADANATAYVVGYSASSNYPRVSPLQNDNAGTDDVVVTKIEEPGDTPGVYVPSSGAWFLRNWSSPGPADVLFQYGPTASTFVPLAGDWNGDGIDTPGLYIPASGQFALRNSNTPGPGELNFFFGAGGMGYIPLAGDWDGDGVDTIGVYVPTTGTFFLRNSNSSGGANVAFSYGSGGASYVPVVGDWNGDGVDTIGIYDTVTGAWFLRDANSAGPATYVFTFGTGGSYAPIVGDWNADGIDTVGIYDATTSTWFLKNTNANGAADYAFSYGPSGSGAMPVAGDWNR